jgi:hypothetical protein
MNKIPNEMKVQVRFPPDVWEEMKQLASEHDRSANGEIIWALRHYIQDQRKESKHADHQKDQA